MEVDVIASSRMTNCATLDTLPNSCAVAGSAARPQTSPNAATAQAATILVRRGITWAMSGITLDAPLAGYLGNLTPDQQKVLTLFSIGYAVGAQQHPGAVRTALLYV